MILWPRHLVPEKSFFRKLFTVASGTFVGQLLVVASAPLLTRLFTPEAFGLFAVFSAVTAIIAIVICLRLEFALPVIATDDEAATVFLGASMIASTNGLLTVLLVALGGPWFIAVVDAEPIAAWIWLVPIASWVWGIGSLLTYWSLRRGAYRVNGLNRMLTLSTQAGGQVGLGVIGFGSPSLILGYVLGYLSRLGHHVACLSAADRLLLSRVRRPAQIWKVVKVNWRYPAFAAPSALLHCIAEMVPAVAIAALYGPAAAGLYALGQRVMSIPIKLLGEAASEVFLGEGRALESAALHRFFLRTTALFVVLGIAGILPILLFAPYLFGIIFGEKWMISGVFVQLLAPLYFARFITHPISQVLNIMKRQDLHFLTAFLNSLAILTSFGVGYYLNLAVERTILIFSLSASASFLLALMISWQLTRKAAFVGPSSGENG